MVIAVIVVVMIALFITKFVKFVFADVQLFHSCYLRIQKLYQKYRKQCLKLCCCAYHVPPGPGPGGGYRYRSRPQPQPRLPRVANNASGKGAAMPGRWLVWLLMGFVCLADASQHADIALRFGNSNLLNQHQNQKQNNNNYSYNINTNTNINNGNDKDNRGINDKNSYVLSSPQQREQKLSKKSTDKTQLNFYKRSFRSRSKKEESKPSEDYVSATGSFVDLNGCPNCVYHKYNSLLPSVMLSASQPPTPNPLADSDLLQDMPKPTVMVRAQSDTARLESIKRQILSKLGLSEKPNVTHPLPKQFIWDTIYRADGINSAGDFDFEFKTTTTLFGDAGNYKTAYYNYTNANAVPNMLERTQMHRSHHHGEPDYNEGDDFFGSTQEIITFAERGQMFNGHRLIEFSTPSNQISKQKLYVRNAIIHIKIDRLPESSGMPAERLNETHLKIWIFKINGNDFAKKEFDQMATLSTTVNVNLNTMGWQKLDITDAVQGWYAQRHNENLRLLVDCTGCGQRYVLHLFEERKEREKGSSHSHSHHQHRNANEDNQNISRKSKASSSHEYLGHSHHNHNHNHNHHHQHQHRQQFHHHYRHRNRLKAASLASLSNQTKGVQKSASAAAAAAAATLAASSDQLNPNRPFLVLHTEPVRSRRVRRRAVDCSGAMNGQCCKESFYVSFKALGWDDWIIAPRGYFANYCRGECTGPYRTPDTFHSFHAHFIEEYRKMDLLNGMQPCCAPLKFSSMSLIYYGDDGIIKRDLPKMVVDECGCP